MSVTPAEGGLLMRARDLKVHFPIKRGVLKRTVGHVRAVDGVSLDIRSGETLSIVGESGCGKTTLGQALVRVLEPTAGSIEYRKAGEGPADIAHLGETELRRYRSDIRMIFQDPFASLNPRRRVVDIIGESLRNFGVKDERDVEARVATLLRKVGLRPEYMSRYPYAFSGGERQRIGIARALAVHPRLVVADECVSALDVSIQAQTLNLMQDLQEEFALTYVFISHDLSVVEYISDRVAVMYAGRIVELSDTEPLFAKPRHPYTAALLASVPRPDPRSARMRKHMRLKGKWLIRPIAPAAVPFIHAAHSPRTFAAPKTRNCARSARPMWPAILPTASILRE